MSLQKYQATILITTLSFSFCFPPALFAKDSTNIPINISEVSPVSKEVHKKFLQGKQQLKALGNPIEYKDMEVQWDKEKGKPSKLRKLHKKVSKDVAKDTKKVFSDMSALYNIDGMKESPDIRLEKNSLSKNTKEQHARLKQFYNNIEIIGGDMISHIDKEGYIYQIDGAIEGISDISTKPTISAKDALKVAKMEHGSKNHYKVINKPEIVLYKFASSYILAYQYTIGYDDSINHIGQWMYYIDAHTGKKINSYSLIHGSWDPVTVSGSVLDGEGGAVKSFTGVFDSGSGTYNLYDNSAPLRKFYVYNASTNTGLYTDANDFANRTVSDWGVSDKTEVSAAYNISKTLEYFNSFGFGTSNISFTWTGQTFLPVYIHYGTGYNNAFWNPGIGLYIGDGDGVSMKPLATLDVMAHEFAHAWTSNTSNLIYQNEQGALSESFSDIAGVNVEFYAQQSAKNLYPSTGSGQADWFIGEDIMINQSALRDMKNPTNTVTVGTGNEQPSKYKGTYWYSGSGDNGGVHYNSSIQNLFYYLLVEGGSGNNEGILYSVDGIGITEASRIAFETNTHFVTSTTDYKGVRQSWIDAANSLHPTDPSFAASIKAAWDAVGVVSNPIISLATADESFENSTDLPVGYTSSLLYGTGTSWAVSTTTGAIGNNSLVSGVLSDSSSNGVSWSGVTDVGYMTFYWRTSSEATYDKLNFYIDGVKKKYWSGINPWAFHSEAITSGFHTFEWTYSKDLIFSGGLDQVGIDAVHVVSMTGSLNFGSDTGSGQYVSAAGFHGTFDAPTSYDYIVSRSDGQMSKGSASGALTFPLNNIPEGSGSIDFQYRDSNGFLSKIFTQNFFLDSIAPTETNIIAPLNESFTNTGNITLTWNPVSDSGAGAGLSDFPYTYLVSTDSGFINIVTSGSVSTANNILSLPDNVYYAKIEVKDLAGNISTSSVTSFIIDTTIPSVPTNILVNNGMIIDASTQSGVTIIGSGGISESGSIVTYNISSSSGGISGSGFIDSLGSFYFSGIDVSTFDDGMLSYTLSVIDRAGNGPSSTIGTIGKSVIPAAGNIVFLSGSYTNNSTTNVQISAEKAVSYSISGSGILSTVTGSLVSSGNIIIPIDLSANDGNKIVRIDFVDSAEVITSMFTSIILDTIPPTLSIDSYSSGVQVTGSTALMTGSIFDLGGIASATLNSVALSSPSQWSRNMNLVGGDNTFTLMATDNAGNSTSLPLVINRKIALLNIISSLAGSMVQINFDTDLSSTGAIHYGTHSGNLNITQDAVTLSGYHQSITLTGLASDTTYYYSLSGSSLLYNSSVSEMSSFHTPKILNLSDTSSSVASTGAVVFSGSSATGSTVFQGTGILSIKNAITPTDMILVNFSGLTITTSGTGVWDGVLESPKVSTLTGVILGATGYTLTGSIYKAGNDNVSLSFSGQYATVQIYIGTSFNGKILQVYRSDTGSEFTAIDSCTVSAGICEFQTNHFSYFAFGSPNDSTPDTFSFTAQTGVELSTNIDSNIITLTGTNTPAEISIVGGSYSINNLAYTNATGTISSGNTIKVRITSSSSYNTALQTILSIGGVSATFSVTTKGAPIVSSGGGGGGGGGGSIQSVDVCYQGDSSGNLYDGKCVRTSVISTSTGTQIPVTPSKTFVVSKSGLFSSNSIIASYHFSGNERIPQKVTAELNFFVTKLIKVIDKNAGEDKKKKNQYNKIVKKYISNRWKQTSDEREKRIMEYLYKRSSIVMKIVTQ